MARRSALVKVFPLLLGLSLAATALPAHAAATRHLVTTHVVAHASPATVRISSPLLVTGTITPAVAGSHVVLQRLVAKRWRTLSTRTMAKSGVFFFSVKASALAGPWPLRVSRVATPTTTAGASHTLVVRVTRTSYGVSTTTTAPTVSGGPVVVAGSVHPAAKGTVLLQQLVGSTWGKVATGKLTASHFSLSVVLSPGSHRLRVVKAFTATIAGGTSAAKSVIVPPPPVVIGAPTVTTTALTPATAGVSYSLSLAASGGVVPYAWSAHGLPVGLALSEAGVLSGVPVTVGPASIVVTVTDSRGIATSATLPLQTLARPGAPWGWGPDGDALGTGTTIASSSVPQRVSTLDHVTQVAIGGYTAVALAADGTVWAWGVNIAGELGTGTAGSSNVPVHVPGLTATTAVAAGQYTSYYLKSDGTVWASGLNNLGQIGEGDTSQQYSPVRVASLTGVTAIAAGNASAYALRSDGTVWAWGFGLHGRLGNGATADSHVPVQVSNLTGVTAIAAGSGGGYALRADGTVWSWGYDAQGQLGDNSTLDSLVPVQVSGLSGIAAIAGGQLSGYALTSTGRVWAWGDDAHGELGNNSTTNQPLPVPVLGLTGVTAIAAGFDAAYAVLPGGYAASWGRDDEGQLGNASNVDSPVPVLVIGVSGVFAVSSGAQTNTAFALVAS